jgi:site-specific recombinase XerD
VAAKGLSEDVTGLSSMKEFLGHESLDTLKRYVNLSEEEVKTMHSKCHPRERDEE